MKYFRLLLVFTAFLARLTPLADAAAGDVDPTFGGGIRLTSIGRNGDEAASIAVQSDGKVLVAGTSNGANAQDFTLIRYNSDGNLDPSFNGTGIVTADLGGAGAYDQAYSMVVQTDGKIVVAGLTLDYINGFLTIASVLVRYTATGALDTSFNGTGKVLDEGLGGPNVAVAIQADGKIVLAGSFYNGSNFDFGVSRYTETGALDPSFEGGSTVTPIGTGHDEPYAVAVQNDGKILVAGSTSNGSNLEFAVVRYTSTGALDTSFNGTGIVTTPLSGGTGRALSLAVQSDGKIVVAGYSNNAAEVDFTVVRYTGTGALDTSFNGTGKVFTDFGGSSDVGKSVAVQSDGKITVAGTAAAYTGFDFALARYTSTGALDSTFNTTGKVLKRVGNHTEGRSMAVQSDGRIVLAGDAKYGDPLNPSASQFAVMRYHIGGDLDSSWNPNGTVVTDFNGSDTGSSVALQSDGKIVAAGTAGPSFAVARYTSTGALDPTFNGTGKVTTNVGSGGSAAQSVALQSDGRIVVAGSASSGGNYGFAVARYTSTGALDSSFNGTGFVITPIGSIRADAFAVAVQDDGKIVVVGDSFGSTTADFAIVRYTSTGALDTSFNGTGIRTTHMSGDDFARAVAIQSDGRIVVVGYSDPRRVGQFDPPSKFALARYTSTGALETTVSTPVGTEDYAYSVAIQGDGKIIVAGSALTENSQDIALVRYNSNLTLDSSFHLDGIVTTDVLGQSTGDAAYSVAVQTDGKIVVGGTSYYDFALVRYRSDGVEDFEFGPARTNILTIGSGPSTTHSSDAAFGLAIQSDGKILLAGTAAIPSAGYSDFALVRYLGDAPLPVVLTNAVSRKTHGTAGPFEISLLGGSPAVECRSGGATNDYQVVFNFPSSVTFSSAAVTAGAGSVSGSSGSGTTSATVNLTGISNAQDITVTLLGVNNGTSTGDISVQMGVLVGDTNGDRFVNAGDSLQTRNRSGQATDVTNFRSDVNTDGFVNSGDTTVVRARSGQFIP